MAGLEGEAEEITQELSSAQVQHLREKAQTDLYFLSKAVLGYTQVEERAHAALCAFMVRERRDRRLVLMPRGHLKTTVCTISDSIRLSVKDPNIRILIQNEVFDNAADMLHELKQHWVQGEMLKFLFPELVPERFSGPGSDWSRDAASIRRTSGFKESTYTAAGSGGSPQSKHFQVIKNDDLVGEKAKESTTEMERAIRWADAQEPLLDRLEDQLDFYGTRKTMSDVYSHLESQLGDKLAVFVREPIEEGIPIFSKFTLEKLQWIMEHKPETWAHDYMNNPIGKGGLDWGQGLIRNYHVSADGRFYLEDHITGKITSYDRRELDIIITADPNSGKLHAPDKAAVIVHGVTPRQQILILEAWSERVSPDGFIDKIWQFAQKWQPRVVGIEDAGQQNALYYFEKRCNAEKQYFRIQPLKHGNQEKSKRIRFALDTPLKARRLYLLAGQITLRSQIQMFPQLQAHNWDEIDCTAYGPQLYQDGMALEDIEADHEAETKILSIRGITGYGVSYRR